MPYLKYISDEDLCHAVARVVAVIEKAELDNTEKLHKNVLDPFTALFDGVIHTISYKSWIKQEKARQIQKTMQNAIGYFHEDVLGSVHGWESLDGGLDVVSKKKKIIAEIKNKYNTTKGNHRTEIYDAIKATLKSPEYDDYVGYFVEIIPKGRGKYDKPFTPSDNKNKGKHRLTRKNIRIIDGASFYALATGQDSALQELFEVLPQVIIDKHKYKLSRKDFQEYFKLFELAFSTE